MVRFRYQKIFLIRVEQIISFNNSVNSYFQQDMPKVMEHALVHSAWSFYRM